MTSASGYSPHGPICRVTDYRPRGDSWRHAAAVILEAWRAGLTGYQNVDAGMRQLAHEGFMHETEPG